MKANAQHKVTQHPSATAVESRDLAAAFAAFNDHSTALNSAYRQLQAQVATLAGALHQAQDGRDRELAEKEKLTERLAGILEALPALVIIVDARGVIADANVRARDAFGVELVGEHWADIASEAFGVARPAADEYALSGHWYAVTESRLEPSSRLIVFIDVTDARATRQQAEREARLATLGEMSARLAHQIRTPLAAAMLWAQQAHAPRQRDRMLSRLRDIESMVGDMLRFARGTPADRVRIDLATLLREVTADARLLKSDDIHLQSAIDRAAPLVVDGQRNALGGALANLLSNAVQHTPTGGVVNVTLCRTGGDAVIEVSNDGPVIPETHREQIFEPFFTTRAEGTGLGLAVVRAVVEAHDGDVECCDRADGASFVVRIPCADQEFPQVGGTASSPPRPDAVPPATYPSEVAHA